MDKKTLEIPVIKKYFQHLSALHDFYRIGSNSNKTRIFKRADKLLTNLEAYGFDRQGFLEPLLMFGWQFIDWKKKEWKVNNHQLPEATDEELEAVFGCKPQPLETWHIEALKKHCAIKAKNQAHQQSFS